MQIITASTLHHNHHDYAFIQLYCENNFFISFSYYYHVNSKNVRKKVVIFITIKIAFTT